MTLKKHVRTGAAALGALAIASVTPAAAADIYAGGGMKDIPVAYVPAWAGFYLGAHIGAAWENNDNNGLYYFGGPDDVYLPLGWGNNNNNDQANAFGGAQLGYNFQGGNFVYGIEVDLGGMSLGNQSHHIARIPGYGQGEAAVAGSTAYLGGDGNNGGFYGDVTGRLGYSWGNWMVYAKGGFAWLESDLKVKGVRVWDDNSVSGLWSNGNNDTLTGWTVGGGVEWKLNPNWSIKAEYLHFDFGDYTHWVYDTGSTAFWRTHTNPTLDTVKLGFNYFWNTAPVPLK